jgi:hypothetical protein
MVSHLFIAVIAKLIVGSAADIDSIAFCNSSEYNTLDH